jgi:hypothetical protein
MDNIFNQNIIGYLGLEHLDKEKQEETLLRVGKIIYQAVMLRVMDILSEDDQKEFEQILDTVGADESKQGDIMTFLNSKIPNLDEISKEEITKFKEDTMNVMGNLE